MPADSGDQFFNQVTTFVLAGALVVGYGLWSNARKRANEHGSNVNEELRGKNSESLVAPPVEAPSDSAKFPGGKVGIFFGSQTGTAEGYSHDLAREGREKGFECIVIDLDDFENHSLPDFSFIIFIVATYGEGEPTDNAAKFVKWLKAKTHRAGELNGVSYTVFGLGNRQYEHYNYIGQFLDQRFQELGAARVAGSGFGDDDGSLEDDFESWKEEMWNEVGKRFLSDVDVVDAAEKLLDGDVPVLPLHFIDPPEGPAHDSVSDLQPRSLSRGSVAGKSCRILQNTELRQDSQEGSTKHISIEVSNELAYKVADNLAVLPQNRPANVQELARSQGYNLQQWVSMNPAIEKEHPRSTLPFPTTVNHILTYYYDISGPPRKSTIRLLARYSSDIKDKTRLAYLGSKEGKDEYRQYIEVERRSIVDVLTAFPSIKIPLPNLLALLPQLSPRYYTISSSPSVDVGEVHITVGIIEEQVINGRTFRGICSGYLGSLQVNDVLQCFVRPSTFRLPEDSTLPIIMIGPGTGIAPMRAFLRERDCQRKSGKEVGRSLLFFGCRSQHKDYLYKDEVLAYVASGLVELHTAFSRDQPNKTYVQHKLEEKGEEIYKLIKSDDAYVYVCGGTAMGSDVMSAFQRIFMKYGNIDASIAQETIKELQESKRYVQELWS